MLSVGSVGLVIVTYQTGPDLWPCLEAASAADGVSKLLLVDNGNPLETEQRIDAWAARDPRVVVLRGQGNIGFAAACNMGASAAGDAELLVFVNPDVVLERDAVTQLLAAMRFSPAPTLVGGALFSPAGQPERGFWRDHVTWRSALASFVGLSRLAGGRGAWRDIHRHAQPLPDGPVFVDVVSGALMALHRVDFEALGGFDEGYFLHVEDVDLCRRVGEAGGRVMLQPLARGVHVRSTSNASPEFVERCKARGFARYFRKFARSWPERMLADLIGAVLWVVLPLRAQLRG